jgi:hypothetical protein
MSDKTRAIASFEAFSNVANDSHFDLIVDGFEIPAQAIATQ